MARDLAMLSLRHFFIFFLPRTSNINSPTRARFLWGLDEVARHIFLEVFFLYHSFNFLCELVVVLNMMSLNPAELASSSWPRTHHILLRRWCKDIVQVEYLAPDLLIVSVQRCEVLCRPTYHFEHSLVLYGRGILVLPLVVWAFGVENALFNVMCLLLSPFM